MNVKKRKVAHVTPKKKIPNSLVPR